MSEQLKTKEACQYLNVSRTTLYKLFSLGQIRRTATRSGKKRLVRWPRRELDKWIQLHTRAAN